jgi:hypothetical protein
MNINEHQCKSMKGKEINESIKLKKTTNTT